MKFALLVLAVFALVWLLRRSLRQRKPPARSQTRAPDAPQPMLSCAHCGLHLPGNEALPGRGGVFCDESHRAAFEKAHPDS